MRDRAPSIGAVSGSWSPSPSPRRGWSSCARDHEVDVRTGLARDEFLRVAARIRRAARAQPGPGRCRGDRGRHAAWPVVGRAGVGVDNIDLAAATAAGIIVVNAPTGNTIAAAEHTLALLFALARHIPAADASLRRGEWKRAPVHRRASCAARRSASSASARSAWPSRTARAAWRWTSSATTRS